MDFVTYWVVKTAVKAAVRAAVDSDCSDADGCTDVPEVREEVADAGDAFVGIVLDALT